MCRWVRGIFVEVSWFYEGEKDVPKWKDQEIFPSALLLIKIHRAS